MAGYDSLGLEGPMIQISAQNNASSYIKQLLLSQLGQKTLISHYFTKQTFMNAVKA